MGEFGYTLVEHSGSAWGGDPTFARGVEVVGVVTKQQQLRVIEAGGMIFDKWIDADDFSMAVMYPNDGLGLIPKARGTFGPLVSNLRLYIPLFGRQDASQGGVVVSVVITLDVLIRLPEGGKALFVEEVQDMSGNTHEAIVWSYHDEFGRRRSYFDIDTGEYLGETGF